MKKEDGGSAFPCAEGDSTHPVFGMSLRDYFAAKALQGMVASGKYRYEVSYDTIAAYAYKQADVMIAARGAK